MRAQVRENFAKQCAGDAAAVISRIDESLGKLAALGNVLRNTTWVKKAYSSSDIIGWSLDHNRWLEIVEEIALYRTSIGIAEGIAVLFPQKGKVVDQYTWGDTDEYFRSIGILRPVEQERLLSRLQDIRLMDIIPYREVEISGQDQDDLLIILGLDPDAGTEKAVLLLQLDSRTLGQMVENLRQETPETFRISKNSGEEVFCISAVQDTVEEKAISFSQVSDMGGLSYEAVYRTDYQAADRRSFLTAMLAFLAALLVGTAVAYWLARLTYRPLRNLLARAGIEGNGLALCDIRNSCQIPKFRGMGISYKRNHLRPGTSSPKSTVPAR